MKVYKNIIPVDLKLPVVTMGMFDGVHKGHLSLVSRVKESAELIGGESVIITFWPHPRVILFPDEINLRYLTTIDEKINLLTNAGIDHLIIIPFTKELSEMTACEFTKSILVNKLNIKHFVAGFDHHFGKNREGSFKELKKCASEFHFSLEQFGAISLKGENISSTRIRKLIEEGKIHLANNFLGYDFFIYGKVIQGNKIGRSIGFPTANIEITDSHKLKPGIGVYAVEVKFENQVFKGMLNIGFRPTINQDIKVKTIEVHIFDFNKDIYDKNVSIVFKKKIREEKKFNNFEELKEQLISDKKTTSDFFGL